MNREINVNRVRGRRRNNLLRHRGLGTYFIVPSDKEGKVHWAKYHSEVILPTIRRIIERHISDKWIDLFTDKEILFYLAKLNEGITYDDDYEQNMINKVRGYSMVKFMNSVQDEQIDFRAEGKNWRWVDQVKITNHKHVRQYSSLLASYNRAVKQIDDLESERLQIIDELRAENTAALTENLELQNKIMELENQIKVLGGKNS
jgi:hypothetical protein